MRVNRSRGSRPWFSHAKYESPLSWPLNDERVHLPASTAEAKAARFCGRRGLACLAVLGHSSGLDAHGHPENAACGAGDLAGRDQTSSATGHTAAANAASAPQNTATSLCAARGHARRGGPGQRHRGRECCACTRCNTSSAFSPHSRHRPYGSACAHGSRREHGPM